MSIVRKKSTNHPSGQSCWVDTMKLADYRSLGINYDWTSLDNLNNGELYGCSVFADDGPVIVPAKYDNGAFLLDEEHALVNIVSCLKL